MTSNHNFDDFTVRIASELDRLKPALEKLSQHLEAIPLSVSFREDLEHFMSRVRDIDRDSDESPGLGDRFIGLPRYFQDISRDLVKLALPESEHQAVLLYISAIEKSLQTLKAIFWEATLPILDAHFGYLWTTEKDDWWLIEGTVGYSITNMSKQRDLIIEDNEPYFYVIERMKEAGNRHVTLDEYAALFPRDLSEGLTFAPPAQASNPPDSTESDNTEH